MTERKIPRRKCLGCGEMKEKKELIRIVRSSDGAINIDLTGKMPGRGAYICKECAGGSRLSNVIKARRFERAFGCEIPKSIYEKLKSEFCENGN